MEMVLDGAMRDNIPELKGIMSRKPIDRKRGPVDDRIPKLLVYGDQQTHETQFKIEEIRQSLNDLVRHQKEGGFAITNYSRVET